MSQTQQGIVKQCHGRKSFCDYIPLFGKKVSRQVKKMFKALQEESKLGRYLHNQKKKKAEKYDFPWY